MPIPYREILLTARIMDAIFDQLRAGAPQDPLDAPTGPGCVGNEHVLNAAASVNEVQS